MTQGYWLMKSEPNEFSIADLKGSPGQTAAWDGVRNYQARNFLRDAIQKGDRVLFYHSGAKPALVGTARVVKAGYADDTAWNPKSRYYDPRSSVQNPIWYRVDIRFESEFARPLALARLRQVPTLADMLLLRKGMRLSVQPVTAAQFKLILKLAVQGGR